MQSKAFTINRPENQTSSFFLPFTISFLCHVVVIVVLIINPSISQRKREMPNVISVSMVSMSKKPSAAKGEASSKKKESPPEKKAPKEAKPLPSAVPVPEPPTQPTSGTADAPKVKRIKRSLKKKTFKSDAVVKKAVKEIEKKVEASATTDHTAAAFADLRKKVKEREEALAKERAAVEQGQGEGDASGEGGEGGGELIDAYRLEIAYQIQKNWALSEQLAGTNPNLQALLVFKVMPDGQIQDVFFTDRSGNTYLDESAYRAVVKSNPVDPHPRGIVAPYIEIGLRFTPEGVK